MITDKKEQVKFYPTEKVEVLPYRRTAKGHKYAITTHGRVVRFNKIPEDGKVIVPTNHPDGYDLVFIMANGKRLNALVHRLVAKVFLPKPDQNEIFVIHKDRNLKNNHYSNLKWVDKAAHLAHAMKGKRWKESYNSSRNYKLTEDRVRMLRRKMKEGKTRIKILAKQFGVSDMQLYRIRSGENWGWLD
jgi:HNH endonuclease